MMLFGLILIPVVLCDRPRGVSISRSSFYVEKNGEFACLDGKRRIPFDQVNDDFCDCDDGSDEPGTAACPNGSFHCTNAGFKPTNILSSRVNDMICDCCDGSDEWAGYVTCPNTCKEAYAKEYADKIKSNAVQAEGWEKRKAMVGDAAAERTQNAVELAEFDNRLNEIKVEKEKAEQLRDSAEEAENAAKAIIEQRKEAKVIQHAAQYDDETLSQIAFDNLDSNSNGELVQYEITSQKYLDPTPESSFLPSEAKTLMKEKEKLMIEDFRTDVWPELKEKIIPKLGGAMARYERDQEDAARKQLEEEIEQTKQAAESEEVNQCDGDGCDGTAPTEDLIDDIALEADIQQELDDLENIDLDEDLDSEHEELLDDEVLDSEEFDDEEEDYNHDDYDGDYDEDYDDDEYNHYKKEPVEHVEQADPELDPETQQIFNTATEARRLYNEVNDKFTDIERRFNEIKEQTDKDFGINDVFLTMYKKCYELKTAEYIYKLCPYDKCSQKSINGGSETKLGNWKGYNEDYSKMEFTGGVRCWNGPDRSATIVLSCGSEHKVLSVDEPNRCEYEYKFETPAACDEPEMLAPPSAHEEL